MLVMIMPVAAVLFAGHWFLYYSWDYFFQIESCAVSETLIVILSVLGVSFLVTLFWFIGMRILLPHGCICYQQHGPVLHGI